MVFQEVAIGCWRRWSCAIVLGVLLSQLLSGCQTSIPAGEWVKAAQAVSGQSLEIVAPTSKTGTATVRLIGIRAPDLQQTPWGIQAQRQLQQMIAGKTVLLESDLETVDSFQRRLAYVWVDHILLNEWLVEQGWALAEARSPNTKYEQRLAYAQEKARLLSRGLWNLEQPMRQTPAEFRQQQP